ncbi:uncharacterized protein LOC130806064 isoform X2 [Amaranthus tricolor]|uniref:uncharacterized protein LOC130806064 isoform X2 n=1 Tax=Amaranthus tricolor TaxID=29722 RepID=UPI00258F70B8|nr:uncharacterized protein LOC130806064 isoform X2 [Amaranthus tricolor]
MTFYRCPAMTHWPLVECRAAGGSQTGVTASMAVFNSFPLFSPISYQQGVSHHLNGRSSIITHKVGFSVSNARPNFSCSVSMADGQSNNNGKLKLNQIMDKAREIWNGLPEPVKSFPWNRVLDNFIQLILDVVVAVIKFLSVPILAISSLSEMSYCARERKLFFVPVPFALGFSVAGILKDTAQEFSPLLKDAEVPWHLILIAVFLALLKLLGPYYPYWGRIFIPHFANGGLLRVIVMMYFWYQKPKKSQLLQNVKSSEQN